MADNIFL